MSVAGWMGARRERWTGKERKGKGREGKKRRKEKKGERISGPSSVSEFSKSSRETKVAMVTQGPPGKQPIFPPLRRKAGVKTQRDTEPQ